MKDQQSTAHRTIGGPGTGMTPDGPRECIHNAPIEAICLDCEREICQQWEKDPASKGSERVLQALERRAEGGGLSVQLTLESFLIEDIRIIRFVRVASEGADLPMRYHVTDGWGSTQISDRDGVLGRIADRRRQERQRSALASSAVPFDRPIHKGEPEENPRQCQSGIPHGQGQCPDCPS